MSMAESQTAFDMEQYKHEQDTGMAGVMPDKWEGHGRILIHERDFSDKKRNFCLKLLGRLNKKYPDVCAERLAEKAIEAAEKRLG